LENLKGRDHFGDPGVNLPNSFLWS